MSNTKITPTRTTAPVAPLVSPPETPLTGQALANAEAQKIEDAKIAARETEAEEQAHLARLRASAAPPLTTRERESLDMSNNDDTSFRRE